MTFSAQSLKDKQKNRQFKKSKYLPTLYNVDFKTVQTEI